MDYNMTRDDIIRMAIESELIYNEEGWCGWVEDTDLRPFIERFAALVAAAAKAEEREACAKVCDELRGINWGPEQCAIAIRARGETK